MYGHGVYPGNGSGGGGRRVVANAVVQGSAQDQIVVGSGGDAEIDGGIQVGRSYEVACHVMVGVSPITTVASYTVKPKGLATNAYRQVTASSSTTVAGLQAANFLLYGDNNNEEIIFRIAWDEREGYNRVFRLLHTSWDEDAPKVDSVWRGGAVWDQTPAQATFDSLEIECAQTDGFGVNSYLTLYDVGPCV